MRCFFLLMLVFCFVGCDSADMDKLLDQAGLGEENATDQPAVAADANSNSGAGLPVVDDTNSKTNVDAGDQADEVPIELIENERYSEALEKQARQLVADHDSLLLEVRYPSEEKRVKKFKKLYKLLDKKLKSGDASGFEKWVKDVKDHRDELADEISYCCGELVALAYSYRHAKGEVTEDILNERAGLDRLTEIAEFGLVHVSQKSAR